MTHIISVDSMMTHLGVLAAKDELRVRVDSALARQGQGGGGWGAAQR